MDLALLMGLQASGKTSFRTHRFLAPHTVISLDQIDPKGNVKNAREREAKLLGEALAARRDVVIDNTNPTREERARYIEAAKQAGYRVVGYYLRSDLKDCIARNAGRPAAERVPEIALKATIKKFERPNWDEGYDELYYVFPDRHGNFVIKEYRE
ncbi:MAG: ATP-binding protein [Planctomycetes bacterium]|nr:ATP-binding protein [Planctomycetota bacterium]